MEHLNSRSIRLKDRPSNRPPADKLPADRQTQSTQFTQINSIIKFCRWKLKANIILMCDRLLFPIAPGGAQGSRFKRPFVCKRRLVDRLKRKII